ncbi:OmpA family protein [Sphingomonas sp.]|jgi:outer membrane protein OmpA-like peptidoglycan-associated protein|uniref:OmpA family protein n=1 Tax=Sphingomonas sp. TaxID=28214 RepID=UPI002D7EB099|nr:OmpA family protein [Sphingomonas sp.]HEU0044668.1 OmpA family protein [Sphingomonas sp.]
MRGIFATATAMAVAITGAPAIAQDADVNSYLCTFAGKCGAETAPEATPTKAAPATKGFRLATSQQPTLPAPATKGFRLATGVNQPTVAAPSTRGFRVARTPSVAAIGPARRAPRMAIASPRRNYAAATRPETSTPGAARADLMLTFEYNSAAMTKAAEGRARGFAQALLLPELKDKRFLIEGHTDARGSRAVNIDLSRRRAQAVADFLIAQGVERSRVETKGYGPDEPLPGRAASAEANRRVEAVLLS